MLVIKEAPKNAQNILSYANIATVFYEVHFEKQQVAEDSNDPRPINNWQGHYQLDQGKLCWFRVVHIYLARNWKWESQDRSFRFVYIFPIALKRPLSQYSKLVLKTFPLHLIWLVDNRITAHTKDIARFIQRPVDILVGWFNWWIEIRLSHWQIQVKLCIFFYLFTINLLLLFVLDLNSLC